MTERPKGVDDCMVYPTNAMRFGMSTINQDDSWVVDIANKSAIKRYQVPNISLGYAVGILLVVSNNLNISRSTSRKSVLKIEVRDDLNPSTKWMNFGRIGQFIEVFQQRWDSSSAIDAIVVDERDILTREAPKSILKKGPNKISSKRTLDCFVQTLSHAIHC